MSKKQSRPPVSRPANLTIPELEQSKMSVLREYAGLCTFASELSIRHRQVHRLVLLPASTMFKPVRGGAIPQGRTTPNRTGAGLVQESSKMFGSATQE